MTKFTKQVEQSLGPTLDAIFRPVPEHEAPHIHAAIEELCTKAGIGKPKLCFVNAEEVAKQVKFL